MRAIDKNNKRMGMYPQMRGGKDLRIVFLGAARAIVLLCTMLLFSSQASALPSYARIDGGPVNRYRDLGADAWYEYLGTGMHNFAAYASYVREDQTRDDLIATSGATNPTGRLYDGTGRNASDNNTLYL